MFKSPKAYRTFLTVLFTYALDLVGFSIVFPVLAPLLLNPNLAYFSPDATEALRTTVLGLLFAFFGIAQFFGSPVAGVLADHYGRYKVFLSSIGLSIVGYAIMAFSVYWQSLGWMFAGRILTGFCSGNFSLAQSATADLTDAKHRSKAFGYLLGVGSVGFIAGPWVGGKLANPEWLFGSGAFIFAAIAALVNFVMVLFFFSETFTRKHAEMKLFETFKDLRYVYHEKSLRTILTAFLLFSTGWAFYLVFFPTYLVQRFGLVADRIGDIYAYQAVLWAFVSMFLNKELVGKFSLRALILAGLFLAAVGVALNVYPDELWPYWIVIPIAITGAATCWVNVGTLLSTSASEHMQGRALGASGAMWSIGQIISPLAAGPLAAWNIYSPLLVGSVCIFIAFAYFVLCYRGKE